MWTHVYQDYFRVVAYTRVRVMYSDNIWVWRLFQSSCVHAYWFDVFSQHMCMKIISEYMRTCVLVWCIQATHVYEVLFRVVASTRIRVIYSDNTWVCRLFQSTCVHAYWFYVFSQHIGIKIISEYMCTRVLVSCLQKTHGYQDYFRVVAYMRIGVMHSVNTRI